VQGQLLQKHLSTVISTTCAHCGQAIHITLDGDLEFQVAENDAAPLVYMPHVDWQTFSEPNIIHAY
jgi:hypothetical protein